VREECVNCAVPRARKLQTDPVVFGGRTKRTRPQPVLMVIRHPRLSVLRDFTLARENFSRRGVITPRRGH
jgi:hypothetical protein